MLHSKTLRVSENADSSIKSLDHEGQHSGDCPVKGQCLQGGRPALSTMAAASTPLGGWDVSWHMLIPTALWKQQQQPARPWSWGAAIEPAGIGLKEPCPWRMGWEGWPATTRKKDWGSLFSFLFNFTFIFQKNSMNVLSHINRTPPPLPTASC